MNLLTYHPLDGLSRNPDDYVAKEGQTGKVGTTTRLGGRAMVAGSSEDDDGSLETRPLAVDPRVAEIAADIMDECRTSLTMSFRFFSRALWHLPTKPGAVRGSLATNNATMYYNPEVVVARFRESSDELARDYLHALLHCLFRQPLEWRHDDIRAWAIATDICVEACAMELAEQLHPSEWDPLRHEALDKLERAFGTLTPQKLYAALARLKLEPMSVMGHGIDLQEFMHMGYLFARDSHEEWISVAGGLGYDSGGDEGGGYEKQSGSTAKNVVDEARDIRSDEKHDEAHDGVADGDASKGASGAESGGDEGRFQHNAEKQHEEDRQDGGGTGSVRPDETPGQDVELQDAPEEPEPSEEDSDDDGKRAASRDSGTADEREMREAPTLDADVDFGDSSPDDLAIQELQRQWEQISRQFQTDLQAFSSSPSGGMGTMSANLQLANRKPIDYGDFLRTFATEGEDLRINDDEFDYVFYTYGLSRYGNMPLIEPLEYKEQRRLRDFAIALDTSGSCSGEVVRTFVARTFEILKETQEYGDEVNIHLIQCDARVQSDTVITSIRQFEEEQGELELHGFGNTDFRPVFDYVDDLLDKGAFTDLRGLVYFTDGYGIFPDDPPQYDVAFVFVEDEGRPRRVPPWATKAVLSQYGIEQWR